MIANEDYKNITVDYVRNMEHPAQGFLCPIEANTYGLEFVYFRIRNYETNDTLVQISKRPEDIGKPPSQSSRKIRYNFGPYFFMLKIIGTILRFKTGSFPVKNFQMIERHYFKNKLIKSYEFTVPFCMPNSNNQMQAIYELPQLSPEQIEDMINNPWQTVSDSFYFVGDQLIMHTKAEFSYSQAEDQDEYEE